MNQITQYLEAYQIFLFAGGVTILLICAWVIIARQKQQILDQDLRIEDLKTLLEIQDKHLKTEEE